MNTTEPMANKTDAGNGSKAICCVFKAHPSPSPDPRRSPNTSNPVTSPSSNHIKLLTDELCSKHGFGGVDYPRLLVEQNFSCSYCGLNFLHDYNSWNSMQEDHIFPTSRGGEDTWENSTICCKTCNFLKRAYESKGSTRDERIADARSYIQSLRARHEARIESLRDLVRSLDSAPNSGT
jgi:5-methylcytosine-specific restriction endonuclease McrA